MYTDIRVKGKSYTLWICYKTSWHDACNENYYRELFQHNNVQYYRELFWEANINYNVERKGCGQSVL